MRLKCASFDLHCVHDNVHLIFNSSKHEMLVILDSLSNSRLELHIHFRRSAGAQCTPLYQGANHNALRFVEVILQLEWIGSECVECQGL